MVTKAEMEPGLVPVFRLFLILQLIWLGLGLAESLLHGDDTPHPVRLLALLAVGTLSLVFFLCWPWFLRRLGRAYLPLGILWATLIPFGAGLTLMFPRQELAYLALSREISLLLIFPLLVVSWQYRFRAVLVYTAVISILDGIGVALTLSASDGLVVDYARLSFTRLLIFLAVGYIVTRLMGEQRKQRQALQSANAEMTHFAATLEQLTVHRERNRLARELHDTLAHTLSGVAVQLEAVRSLWEADSGEAKAMLEKALRAARNGLTETRRAMRALRTAPLEELGLGLALRQLAEMQAERAGWVLTLELSEEQIHLPPDVEQELYRVAQEALENCARHAAAGHVGVRLLAESDQLTLTVSDDGRGFDVTALPADRQHGLRGMRERAHLLVGVLEVRSQPGEGTTIRLQVDRHG
jgi:signal transduction histidine kinase